MALSQTPVCVVRVLWSNRSHPPTCLTQGSECPLLCLAAVGAHFQLSQVEAEAGVAAACRAGRWVVEEARTPWGPLVLTISKGAVYPKSLKAPVTIISTTSIPGWGVFPGTNNPKRG